MEFYLDAIRSAIGLIARLEPDVADALWRSLRVAGISTLVAAGLGIPLGGLIALTTFPGKRAVIALFSTLMALPPVAVGLFLYGLYTRRGALGHLGLLYTETALITAQIALSFPIIVRLSIAAVAAVDRRIPQTALTLGGTRWQTLLLTLREATAGIAVAVITGYGRAISEVGAALIVGGNIRGKTRTLTTAITLEASRGEFSVALALGLLLLGLFFLLNVMLLRLQERS